MVYCKYYDGAMKLLACIPHRMSATEDLKSLLLQSFVDVGVYSPSFDYMGANEFGSANWSPYNALPLTNSSVYLCLFGTCSL